MPRLRMKPGSIAHEVYLLRKYDQLPYLTIAKRLGITKGEVAGHVRRAGLARIRPEPKPKPPKGPRLIQEAPKAHPLVRRLIAEMNKRQVSVIEMCAAVGIAPGTFSHWRTRSNPELQNIEACFNVLGLTLQPVAVKHNVDSG